MGATRLILVVAIRDARRCDALTPSVLRLSRWSVRLAHASVRGWFRDKLLRNLTVSPFRIVPASALDCGRPLVYRIIEFCRLLVRRPGALGPVSNRALLLVGTVVGLGLAVASGWLAVNSPIDVNAPDWQIGVLVCSLAIGSSGAFLAVLHLVREPQPRDRVLAATCLVVNLAAALLAVVSFLPIGG